MLKHFLDTVDTIDNGLGFSSFDMTHLAWLVGGLLFTIILSVIYRRSDTAARRAIRIALTALLLADELFKHAMLIIGGNWSAGYLPLHLCSINIFMITYYTFKPSQWLGNYLYTVCIPGALAALLFPTWTELPFGNFMHLHSFTVHILLAAFPIIVMAGGDIKRDYKQIPKCLLLLAVCALPILVINLVLDTNFMFLMYAEPGNPLYWFETAFGSHLSGFPVLITVVLLVMHFPIPKKKVKVNGI